MLTYEQRKEIKNTDNFKLTNGIWGANKLNSPQNVGSMNKTFKEFYKKNKINFDTMTVDNFMEYYFRNVKTRKELTDISLKLYKACTDKGISISRQDTFYYTIIRVIDETWDGFRRELRMIDYLKELYPDSTVDFTDEEDCDYCVDLKVSYEGVVLDYFQVKPYSFYDGLINDKMCCKKAYWYNSKKHKELFKNENITAYYLIENENGNHIIKKYDELI